MVCFYPSSTDDAYFAIGAHADPTDVEVPQISTPEYDIALDSTFITVAFGCLSREMDFALKLMI